MHLPTPGLVLPDEDITGIRLGEIVLDMHSDKIVGWLHETQKSV